MKDVNGGSEGLGKAYIAVRDYKDSSAETKKMPKRLKMVTSSTTTADIGDESCGKVSTSNRNKVKRQCVSLGCMHYLVSDLKPMEMRGNNRPVMPLGVLESAIKIKLFQKLQSSQSVKASENSSYPARTLQKGVEGYLTCWSPVEMATEITILLRGL
eukprot:1146483-Pelagomonas_calceolata.AAC.3